MIVSALLQPCYNMLHATLLHSGWWPLHGSFDTASLQLLHTNLIVDGGIFSLKKDHLLKDHFINHRGGLLYSHRFVVHVLCLTVYHTCTHRITTVDFT